MRLLMIAAMLLLLTGSAVQAKESPHFSGNELLGMCGSKYDTDYGFCAGYVSAVANLMLAESVAGYRACNLDAIRSQQFVDIFTGYAELFQADMKDEANRVVAAAIARAFPCAH